MAVGTVSGVDPADNWQLITSVTPSGTSTTFSSLSGYKHIWITGKSITTSAAAYISVRPNNDTAVGSYASYYSSGDLSQFYVNGNAANTRAFHAKIYNIDQTVPHLFEPSGAEGVGSQGGVSVYTNPVAITSLVVFLSGSVTFTGGTMYIYGIPA
jgi:hypothetical protein